MPTDRTADPTVDLTAELQRRWDETLPGQPEMGSRVIARYAEPHRRYHDQRHLLSMLETVDELAGDQDLFLVRLATFFHDAVYAVPELELTNEEASARLSRRELGKAGLEQEDLNEVARLVKLTADHVAGSRDPEGELICDADLAVLGRDPQAYAAYVAGVRAEYATATDEQFDAGRFEVVVQLLDLELFRTAKGRALTEQARTNLEAEGRALADRLGVDWEER